MKSSRRRSLSASRTLDSTVSLVGRIGASLRMTTSKKRTKEKQPEKNAPIDENGSNNNWLRYGAHYAKIGVERRRSTCSAIFFGTKTRAGANLSFVDADNENNEEQICEGDQRLVIYNGNPRRLFSHSKSSMEFFVSANNSDGENDDDDEATSPKFIDADPEKNGEMPDEKENFLDDDEDLDLLSLALVPLPNGGNPPQYWNSTNVRSALSSPVANGSTTYSNLGGVIGSKSCPSTPQMPRRRYLKEGGTQLTSLSTLCTHHRYLFLFNDLLLISKQKGENSYKLKEKVFLDRLWISSNNCTHSFLIGWPIHNYIAHFSCESEKEEWFQKLSDCIRRRFRTKNTTIGVSVQIEGREQCIRQEVHNGCSARDLIEYLTTALDLPVLDTHLNHYELCFETGFSSNHVLIANNFSTSLTTSNTSSNSSTIGANSTHQNPHLTSSNHHHFGSQRIHPFNGVENVYAVLMDYVSNQANINLSDSQLAHLDTCPLINCRLMLRKVSVNGSNNNGAFVSKSAALNFVNQFRKVLSRTESSSKRLFGRQLEGSMPPQPVLTMIDHLTIHGAHVEGIFRKSPKQATVRVLKNQLDRGQVPDFHQYNVHVTASLLKEYLRTIPGQLLISNNYHLWMDVCGGQSATESDAEESAAETQRRLNTCRNLLRLLPACHIVLLRSLLRLLRRIIAAQQTSKMGAHSLAVCLAPSLLENPNVVDSARRVPELAIYLMEHAGELFEGLVEECLLPPPTPSSITPRMAPVANSHPIEDEDEAEELEEEELARKLHQSTDSGLSGDGDISTTSSTTNQSNLQQKEQQQKIDSENVKLGTNIALQQRLSVNTWQTAGKLRSLTHPPASISPDSALFDIPLSDCSSYDDENQKQRYPRKLGKSNLSPEKRHQLIQQRPNAGIRIEEIECEQDERTVRIRSRNTSRALSPKSCGAENPDGENEEDEDKTPTLLSRENSDVKTQFGTRPEEWKTTNTPIINSTKKRSSLFRDSEPASPIANDVRILRLKANSASPCTSPQMTPRFPAATASFQISNLDDLRVSDYIISQKSATTNTTRKIYENCEEKSSSRKSSTSKTPTSQTTNEANIHKNPLLRRAALLTRNESLGIPGQRKTSAANDTNSIVSDHLPSSKSFHAHNKLPSLNETKCNNPTVSINPPKTISNITNSNLTTKPIVQCSTPSITTYNAGPTANRQQMASRFAQKESNSTTNPSRISSESKDNNRLKVTTNLVSTQQQRPQLVNIGRSVTTTATNKSPINENFKGIKSAGLVADALQQRRDSSSSNSREHGGLNSASSSFSSTSTNCGIMAKNGSKWRPPKRTAEEIVLDKLEVNWSVPHIRSVFQQHKDVKPASIDTVYARVS